MPPQTFILMGRSGSGKGTQTHLLTDYLEEHDPSREVLHIEPGARFREFIKGTGYSNKLSRDIYDAGGLQPEFVSIWMWSTDVINHLKDNQHIIFDGMPRKPKETPIVDSALIDFYGRSKPYIVLINISREAAVERLKKRGREDDVDPEDIKMRMEWYETDVVPTIKRFRENPDYTFVEVNGGQSIEDIHKDIVEKLAIKW